GAAEHEHEPARRDEGLVEVARRVEVGGRVVRAVVTRRVELLELGGGLRDSTNLRPRRSEVAPSSQNEDRDRRGEETAGRWLRPRRVREEIHTLLHLFLALLGNHWRMGPGGSSDTRLLHLPDETRRNLRNDTGEDMLVAVGDIAGSDQLVSPRPTAISQEACRIESAQPVSAKSLPGAAIRLVRARWRGRARRDPTRDRACSEEVARTTGRCRHTWKADFTARLAGGTLLFRPSVSAAFAGWGRVEGIARESSAIPRGSENRGERPPERLLCVRRAAD